MFSSSESCFVDGTLRVHAQTFECNYITGKFDHFMYRSMPFKKKRSPFTLNGIAGNFNEMTINP